MNFFGKCLVLPAAWIWLVLVCGGCSIPQIIVLKDPLTGREYLRLGVSYESRDQLDLAEAQYQKAASHDIPEAFLFLGNIAYRKKNVQNAETYYRQAIKKMPDDPRAYNNLAWLYYEQGEGGLEKAEHLARQALERVSPEHRAPYEDTLEKILAAREKTDSTRNQH